MPKFVDYPGRFAFFEEAAFAIVRDHGVDQLSRHRVAKVLGTSISTVRRLLSPDADLRGLALREVGHRRRASHRTDPVDALLQLLPTDQERVAAELVWWRLVISAPPEEPLPPDEATLAEGPLHHRYAVGSIGFVPEDGDEDPVVLRRLAHVAAVRQQVRDSLMILQPDAEPDDTEREVERTHALIDGLGLAIVLGRLSPEASAAILRHHLGTCTG